MAERDDAWQRFFEQTDTLHQIAQVGYCYVTADDLKLYGQREPRLMAKIDTLAERPRVFKEHHLSLFPTRNGLYLLFQDPDDRSYYRFGDEIDSLPIQEYVTSADLFAYDVIMESIRYDLYRAQGLQIGSGTIESGCKHVIATRLKQAGMIWSYDRARKIAKVRTRLKSRRWEQTMALRPFSPRPYLRKAA